MHNVAGDSSEPIIALGKRAWSGTTKDAYPVSNAFNEDFGYMGVWLNGPGDWIAVDLGRTMSILRTVAFTYRGRS